MRDFALTATLLLLLMTAPPTRAEEQEPLGVEPERRPSQELYEAVKHLRERVEEDLVPALTAPPPVRRGGPGAPIPDVLRRESRGREPATPPPFLGEWDWEPQAASP
jgi:hypothetical protein